MNIISLIGRFTKDPELKSTPSGDSVCSFTIAVNSAKKDKDADFIPCVAWKQTAEFISKYFAKGKMIWINGNLQQRSYTDRDGNNRIVYEVVVNRCGFCGDKTTEDKPQGGFRTEAEEGFEELADDDLPF